jgi:hypothetical protein
MENSNFGNQTPLPNATAVLVLGIASIVGCCCQGIVGLVLAIMALVMANNSLKLYNTDPASYTTGSYKNLNAGKICAIIGLVLSSITVIANLVLIAQFGWGVLTDPSPVFEYYGVPNPY